MELTMNRYVTTCPIGCTGELRPSEIHTKEGSLLLCSECGQLLSRCNERQFSETMREFDHPDGTWPAPQSVASQKRAVAKFIVGCEKIVGKPRSAIRLLDVGCSNGAFLYTAQKMGLRGTGVEPAMAAADAARKVGLDVRSGFLQDLGLTENSYDVITLFEVVEHLREPMSLLQECHRLLRPNGMAFIKTANTISWTVNLQTGDWHYFDMGKHGGHISFFNPASISLLAARTGFEPAEIVTKGVELADRERLLPIFYRPVKIFQELLQLPAKLCGKGQELFVFLRKT